MMPEARKRALMSCAVWRFLREKLNLANFP